MISKSLVSTSYTQHTQCQSQKDRQQDDTKMTGAVVYCFHLFVLVIYLIVSHTHEPVGGSDASLFFGPLGLTR